MSARIAVYDIERQSCTVCGEEKPLHEYHRDRRRPSGRVPRCKGCTSEYKKRYYEANGEYVRAHVREYGRKKRLENPPKGRPKAAPLAERMYANTIQAGDDPIESCWLWQGGRITAGYGALRGDEGRNVFLHRASWEHFNGPIPDGLHIDHLCRVRNCINPWHLEPVTIAVNNMRAVPYRRRAVA